MTLQTKPKACLDIEVGDALVFFGKAHRVVAFEPYEGVLLSRLGEGTRIALCDTGESFTLPAVSTFEVGA